MKKLDAARLWDYALKSVGSRSQTIGEIRVKLKARAVSAADVEPTIAKLKEYGLVDDVRFAQSFAEARLENRGFGQMRALRDLRTRRVAPAVAAKAVERAYSGRDERLLVESYIRRKYRAASRESLFQEKKDLAAAFRRLRLAGFRSGPILDVLKRFAANPDLLDGFSDPEDDPLE